MVLWAALLVTYGASLVGSMPASPGTSVPENITIVFLSPSEVRVSWKTASQQSVEKYDVTYKPTDARSVPSRSYRVVVVVAGNSESVTLRGLEADTQYSVTITAVRDGKKFRSRPVVFRTLEKPKPNDVQITGSPPGSNKSSASSLSPNSKGQPPYLQTMSQVRGVEVGIVCLVLLVWVGSIILFFNRWGKIRMLLPYQPDYKDTQLKVPGTGTCQGGPSCQSASASAFCCPQRYVHRCVDDFDWRSRPFGRPSRSRINSAIYIATHHRSEEHEPLFDPSLNIVRKAKSADNLPLSDFSSSVQRPDVPILSVSIVTEKPVVEQHL